MSDTKMNSTFNALTIAPADSDDARLHFPNDPFVGLRPFKQEEGIIFFGRHDQGIELMGKLRQYRFLSVIGSSGCGKSSLIRAGLIPKLKAGFMVGDRDQWRVAVMKPGASPLYNLSVALLQAFPSVDPAVTVQKLQETVNLKRTTGCVEWLGPSLTSTDVNLLLLVDQFEEIFRYSLESGDPEKQDEAADFVSIMLGLAEQRTAPIYVVMTMRSDFLGDCDNFQGLPEALNRSQYLVPRLTRQQRRQAIEGPVRLFRQAIAPRLLDRLLYDMGDQSDQLPIMQHAMLRTWENWCKSPTGPLDLPNYVQIGGFKKALSKDADAALKGLSDEDLKLTKRIFQALTNVDERNRRIRRPAKLSELEEITGARGGRIAEIIKRFQTGGRSFLSDEPDGEGKDPLIDISHESLIREWEQLLEWVKEEERSARIYRRLVETALLHEAGKEDLLRDPGLQVALDWRTENNPTAAWARRYHPDFDKAMAFLKASEAEHAKKLAEKEREEKAEADRRERDLAQAMAFAEEQRLRAEAEQALAMEQQALAKQREAQLIAQSQYAKRLRWYVRALAVAAAVAIALAFWGFNSWKIANAASAEANRNANLAQEQKEEAVKHAEERKKALVALEVEQRNLINARDTLEKEKILANNLRVKAEKIARAEKEAQEALTAQKIIADNAANSAVAAAEEAKNAACLAREQKVIADKAAFDAKIERDNAEKSRRITEDLLEKIKAEKLVAVSSAELDRNPTRSALLAMHALSKELRLKDQQEFKEGLNALRSALPATMLTNMLQQSGNVERLGFTKDGRVVTSDNNGSAKIWDVKPDRNADGEVFRTNQQSSISFKLDAERKVNAVAISSDGAWLAIGQDNGYVKYKSIPSKQTGDPDQNQNEVIVKSHRHPISRLAFSNPKTFEQAAPGKQGFLLAASSVFWSSSVSDSETNKNLWRRPNLFGWARLIFTRAATNHLVSGLAFSDDGRHLAIARKDGRIELRDAEKSSLLLYWEGHGQSAIGAVFDPSGEYLVTVGSENQEAPTLKLWTVAPDAGNYRKHGMFENILDKRSPVLTLTRKGDRGAILGAAFSPVTNGQPGNSLGARLLAAGNQSGYVTIWELKKSGEKVEASELISFQAHNGRVSGIAFSEFGQRLHLTTSGSDDQVTKVWEIPSLEYLRKMSVLLNDLSDLEQVLKPVSETPQDYTARIEGILSQSYELLPRKRLTDRECNDYLKEKPCAESLSGSVKIPK